MKVFETLVFDPAQCHKEVTELRKWLARHVELKEREQVLPFLRRRNHLAAFIASYNPNVIRFDRIAFEYPIFGDFTCDLAVGDSKHHAYCFIELENAGRNSLFVKQGKKATREWSPRFDHGYSQIIDWFCKLSDMEKSNDFAARFGARIISYSGLLIVGRDQHLQAGERDRLEWRRRNVIVGSQTIHCVTYDELLQNLEARWERYSLSARAGG